MPRTRLLKPEFFLDAELCDLPIAARLLFAGLWVHADREGRLEDKPRELKVKVFPYEDSIDVDELLWRLHEAEFIVRYEAGGKRVVWIVKFLDHQSPHVNEKPSIFGAFQPGLERGRAQSGVTHESLTSPRIQVSEDSRRSDPVSVSISDPVSVSDPPPRPPESAPNVVPLRTQKPEEEGSPFWEFTQEEREKLGRTREKKPEGFDDWARGAEAEVGPERLSCAYARFLLDDDFKPRGWPIRVFQSPNVWRQRANPARDTS